MLPLNKERTGVRTYAAAQEREEGMNREEGASYLNQTDDSRDPLACDCACDMKFFISANHSRIF